FFRAMYPFELARMVYHVGSPAMFDGNMFFPETGTPIWKIERRRTRLAVWLPDPLTVATWMAKSLTMRSALSRTPASCSDGAITDIYRYVLPKVVLTPNP